MKSLKILHTGDLHLCSPMLNMGIMANGRKNELLETFLNIIRLAQTENVDALFVAGDLFENSNPDAATVEYVVQAFKKLKETKVFLVLGNHDYDLHVKLPVKLPENVYLFKNYMEKVSIDNADIYGVSFDAEHCPRCITEGFSADDEERINILLVHGDVQTNSVYNPISIENIKYSKMDYIALGHVHAHNGFETTGATTYSYCGIPEGRAFDECGEKGVIIAEVGKGYVKGEFVPVCSRKYMCKSVDVSGVEDNLQIAEKIVPHLEGTENAYRISLKGVTKTFVDKLFIKKYLEKEFYYIEVEDDTEKYSDNEYSLKNLFVKNCDNEDAVKYGLMALRGEKVIIE